jgi:agmatinase
MGVPFDGAVSFRKGAAQAPASIRAHTHYMPPITEEGHLLNGLTICDYGDAERDLNWERYFASVAEQALTVLDHPFALFLGGDHSVTSPARACR